MKNPLTFRVESSLGAVYISMLSMFFIGLIFVAIKNFESEVDVMSVATSNSRIKRVSQAELVLVQEWMGRNDIIIPEGQGYRYLLRKYPSRPWITE